MTALAENQSTPEARARRAEDMRGRWADPTYRQERIEFALAMWADPEQRKKICLARDGFLLTDEDRIYPEVFNERLRQQIRERDGNKCVLCGSPRGKYRLAVHHIDYDKKNNDPVNLIALCAGCHNRTGRNRLYWQMLFTTLHRSRIADWQHHWVYWGG